VTPPREPSALERLRQLERDDLARRQREAAGSGADGSGSAAGSVGTPRRRGILGGVVAALLLLVAKGKTLLLLLATKGLVILSALGKLGWTLATMGASFWFYAQFYGWSFGIGLVVLILVHELGHGLAAKLLGLRVGAPIFIPGFGAVIALKEQPRSTWVSAVVGYGGPLAGTLGGLVVLLAGPFVFDAGLAKALAHYTFLINFFNLVPVAGLDGDRISEPLGRVHWVAGLSFTAIVAMLLVTNGETHPGRSNPQLVFTLAILALGIVKAIRVHRRLAAAERGDATRLLDRVVGRQAGYTEEAGVERWQRRATSLAYFGLIGVLTWLVFTSEPPPRSGPARESTAAPIDGRGPGPMTTSAPRSSPTSAPA
jgi:Zn-dependent protease